MQKPRISYAQYQEQMKQDKSKFAAIISSFMEARRRSPLGLSEKLTYCYRFLQDGPLGPTDPRKWDMALLMNYGRDRKANRIPTKLQAKPKTSLSPATVGSDFTNIRVILTWAAEEFDESLQATLLVLDRARKKLRKHERAIAKPNIRERRPTEDELERLLAHFEKQNKLPQTEINMVAVVWGSVTLGRRIGELCSIQRKHVDLEKKDDKGNPVPVYRCYQSKQRVWRDFVLYQEALEVVRQRLAEIPEDPEAYLWPYKSKSCSQRYIDAKHKLGIVDLRLHDNRRECFSRLFAKQWTVKMVQFGVSGHIGDGKTLERVYTKVTPEEIHAAIQRISSGLVAHTNHENVASVISNQIAISGPQALSDMERELSQ